MAKKSTNYVCQECGYTETRWAGQCGGCGKWNTLIESVVEPAVTKVNRNSNWAGDTAQVVNLRQAKTEQAARMSTGLPELDRVLGGGLAVGSVNLIGGDPGVGKSTLLMQVLGFMSKAGDVFYATGEESTSQLQLRQTRLGLSDTDILVYPETEVENIIAELQRRKPRVAVVDSIQTVYSSQLTSSAGSVSQVRECAAMLTKVAKQCGISLFIVGHVTKEGSLAGPKVLEHIVDGVLYFENETTGDMFRLIRVFKNRFGAVNELGVFAMGAKGLEEVSNPSSLFLTPHEKPVAGSAIFAALEGTRPYLVEVQVLVEDAPTPNPKRFASGLDSSRLQLLLAVLNKHVGISAFDMNVYLKVVGGVRLSEPAADLPALLAAQSSIKGRAMPEGLVVIGEVGLAGEVRAVRDVAARLKEAVKLGYTRAIVPAANKHDSVQAVSGIKIEYVTTVEQAVGRLRD